MRAAALGEVAEVVSGATPKSSVASYWGGDVSWATPTDLSALDIAVISSTSRTLTRAGLESCAARELPPGSVLLSSRAPIGLVAINSVPMATNQGFKSFVPRDDKLDAKYLYHWLRSQVDMLKNLGNGATFKELSKATVERLQIPLPRVEEQRRLASILNQAVSIQARRRTVVRYFDELSLTLYRAMFGPPEASGWGQVTLAELGRWASGGTPPRAQERYFEGDIPWFSSGELGPLFVSDSKEHVNAAAISETSVKNVPAGSILLGMYDTAALKSSITTRWSTCNQAVAFSEVEPSEADTLYVYHAIRAIREQILARRRGIRQKNLNLSIVREISIPRAPLPMQHEFSDRVKRIHALRSKAMKSVEQADELFASLQAHAFGDEL